MENHKIYTDEEECFKIITDLIYPQGFECPGCGGKGAWFKPKRRIIICRKCRKEISPLAGTLLSRSHLQLTDWFNMLHMLTCSPQRVVTAKSVYIDLSLGSYRTAWEALNKARFAISENEPRRVLEGTVEFDEMVVSGVESDYRKLSILGALEVDGLKRLSLKMIKNPDEMNIKDYIRNRFRKNVRMIVDPEKLYIQNWFELNRIAYSGTEAFYGINFMNLHIILQDVRYGLKKGHHGVSEKYLQRNLDEYAFVFNHNDDREGAFRLLLRYMVETGISAYRRAERRKKTILSIITGE